MSKVFLIVASHAEEEEHNGYYHTYWTTWVVSAHTSYQLAGQTIEEAIVIGKLKRPPDADKGSKFLYEADRDAVREYTEVVIEEFDVHGSS